MTRAVYINADAVNGPTKARTLNCGWLAAPTPDLAGVPVPCAVVEGPNGRQVFPEPITNSQVTNAIAADVALDVSAAQAQAVLDANAATLRSRAQTALTTNATYIAIASPTTAQNTAQVKALTRQVDGVIRLLLNQTDSVADS